MKVKLENLPIILILFLFVFSSGFLYSNDPATGKAYYNQNSNCKRVSIVSSGYAACAGIGDGYSCINEIDMPNSKLYSNGKYERLVMDCKYNWANYELCAGMKASECLYQKPTVLCCK